MLLAVEELPRMSAESLGCPTKAATVFKQKQYVCVFRKRERKIHTHKIFNVVMKFQLIRTQKKNLSFCTAVT